MAAPEMSRIVPIVAPELKFRNVQSVDICD
jgi:hypothetical protein